MIVGLVALVSAACFLGAAFYINFAEHAGRMGLNPADAIRQWAPGYVRGYLLQGTLALVAGLTGAICWWQTGNGNWGAGAMLMLANWPWTLLAIRPVNRQLIAMNGPSGACSDEQAIALLNQWSDRHTIRTVLGLMAVISFGFALAW